MITIIPTDKVEQGSEEWKTLRSQYITATDVYNLLQGQSIQQILQQKANNTFRGNYYTERGHILEEEAKEIYSKVYQPTYNVGFVINDKYPLVGMSPDGLVGEDGLVEVKCFNLNRHYEVYRNLDPKIITQIQYQLWVSERDWDDLVLYNPDNPNLKEALLVRRITPNLKIHQKFEDLFSNLENLTSI